MYATWVRFDDATRAEYRESAAAFLATLAPAGVR
jgi:deoxyribodipyrimidine photolyase-related protein